LAPKEAFFSQGDPADSVFYLQKGRAKVTVVSPAGKEATITLLSAGDFVGEEALAAMAGLRLATATAITACTALRISREEMIRVMHEEHSFSDLFLKVMLERSMRIQADLVDQLFNSSEKRLARILLLMAEFRQAGRTGTIHSQDLAGDPGGDDRHHPLPRQLLHEPISQARVYRIQRAHQGSQVAVECGPA
jgi:CRP/FNR family transcriptional regulator, cyclic AMP receptor protein